MVIDLMNVAILVSRSAFNVCVGNGAGVIMKLGPYEMSVVSSSVGCTSPSMCTSLLVISEWLCMFLKYADSYSACVSTWINAPCIVGNFSGRAIPAKPSRSVTGKSAFFLLASRRRSFLESFRPDVNAGVVIWVGLTGGGANENPSMVWVGVE